MLVCRTDGRAGGAQARLTGRHAEYRSCERLRHPPLHKQLRPLYLHAQCWSVTLTGVACVNCRRCHVHHTLSRHTHQVVAQILERNEGLCENDSPCAWYFRHRKHLTPGWTGPPTPLPIPVNSANPSFRHRKKAIEAEVTDDTAMCTMFSGEGDY
jgi:hypothetical protein